MINLKNFDDPTISEADLQIYLLVVDVANRYGVDPSSSVEAEAFFHNLLREYTGASNDLESWLDQEMRRHFHWLSAPPRWIQGAEWPFAEGQPMIFAGQIDLNKAEREKVSPTLFHDDTALYIFLARGLLPVVVIQQF